jgi:hypothetical protein
VDILEFASHAGGFQLPTDCLEIDAFQEVHMLGKAVALRTMSLVEAAVGRNHNLGSELPENLASSETVLAQTQNQGKQGDYCSFRVKHADLVETDFLPSQSLAIKLWRKIV